MAQGDPTGSGGALELRFVPSSVDMQQGDLLTTSGIDGVYPAGLHVARINRIDRRVDTSFARVHAQPMAQERGRHLLVLMPVKDWPKWPAPSVEPPRGKAKASAAPKPAAATPGATP